MHNQDSPIPIFKQPRPASRFYYIWISVICIALIGAAVCLNEIYYPHPQFVASRTIEIPPGFGSRMIGDKLKREGFIRSKWMFVTYILLRGEASSLKPGAYDFQNASIPAIAGILVKGISREKVIPLPEGATINDLAQILQDQKLPAGTLFAEFASRPIPLDIVNQYPFLAQTDPLSGLEGYLFPDTYHIFKESSPQQIAEILLQNFNKKVTQDMRDEIKRSGKTLQGIIIMASLIEKEVVPDADRKMVSGILWNRLRLRIPLQVDATISYIKKQKNSVSLASDGRISIADLALNSPYNTYTHKGLPAGPIGNPGLSAMLAAIHPTTSSYIYYLSTPDGRTIYSKTLEQHNAAKRKYLTK